MVKAPRSGSSSEVVSTEVQDLHPTSDIRFVMNEVGKLTAKTERLISDVEKQSEKIDAVRHQITFVRGALWVIGAVLVLTAGLFTWYLTGKFSITVVPSPPG